jgi:RHS repeat-associated protein
VGDKSVSETFGYSAAEPDRIGTVSTSETGLPTQNVTLSYDAQGRVSGSVRNGVTTTLGYNGSTPTEFNSPGFHRSMEFDTNGSPTRFVEQGIVTSLTYDAQGRIKTQTSQGARDEFDYQVANRLRQHTVVDVGSGGVLLDETFAYDAAGRVRSVTAEGITTTYAYFPDNKVQSTDVNGTEMNRYTRNGAGLLTDASFFAGALGVTYDEFDTRSGNPRKETVRLLDGTLITRTYTYDDVGRRTGSTLPGGVGTTVAYDGFGRVASETDGDGVVTGTTNSPTGLPLVTRFADGTSVRFEYNDNLTLRSQGGIEYEYDENLLPASVSFPDRTSSRYALRNSFLEPDSVVIGGVQQVHTWEEGRLRRVDVNSTGDHLEILRDGLGRETRVSLNGHSVTYEQDMRFGIVSEVGPLGRWHATVDPIGRITREEYPSGWSHSFGHGPGGVPTASAELGVTSAEWLDVTLPKRIDFESGLRIQWEYDGAGRNRAIRYLSVTSDATNALAGFEYGMTPGNRITSETRTHEGATDIYLRNSPAEGMRVTGVHFSAASATTAESRDSVTGLAFDGDGELLLGGAVAAGSGARVLLPGVADRLVPNSEGSAESGPIWVNINGLPGRFDARFTYDGFNQLRKVERLVAGVVRVTVVYQRDGQGRVVRKTVTGPAGECVPGVWQYVWRGDKLIEEHFGADREPLLVRRYLYFGDILCKVQSAQNPGDPLASFIPLVGLNGSIGGYLAENGTLAEVTRYGLYGLPEHVGLVSGVTSPRSAVAGTLQFHGAFFDEETGLYHMGGRVLHPVLGRFLQRDPDLYVHSRALHTAFDGDPASNVDPTGSISINAIGFKEQARWLLTPQMIAKGGIAAIKPTFFETKGGGAKFFLTSNSKAVGMASSVFIGLCGITAGESRAHQEFVAELDGALSIVKYSLKAIEEWQDFAKTGKDLAEATKKHAALGLSLGNVFRSQHKNGTLLKGTVLGPGAFASEEAFKGAKNQFYDKFKKRNALIFAKSDYIGNKIGIGKAVVGLPRALIKDLLHWDKQDDTLKWVGLADAASSSLDFATSLSGAITTHRLVEATEGSAYLLSATKRRLSVGGGFLDVPANNVFFKAYSVYSAFDAGFSAGKGAITFGLGLVDPSLAREYYNTVKMFENDGGFLTALNGALGDVGVPVPITQAVQNFSDTSFMPNLEGLSDSLQVNPPFSLYYRGINAP